MQIHLKFFFIFQTLKFIFSFINKIIIKQILDKYNNLLMNIPGVLR